VYVPLLGTLATFIFFTAYDFPVALETALCTTADPPLKQKVLTVIAICSKEYYLHVYIVGNEFMQKNLKQIRVQLLHTLTTWHSPHSPAAPAGRAHSSKPAAAVYVGPCWGKQTDGHRTVT